MLFYGPQAIEVAHFMSLIKGFDAGDHRVEEVDIRLKERQRDLELLICENVYNSKIG